MVKSLASALVISPFLALLVSAAFYQPSPESKAALAEDDSITSGVRACLEAKGPWKCFETLQQADADLPLEKGEPRTLRLASLVTAQQVIEFCDLQRKVDCANRMFGSGYDVNEITAGLAAVGK